MGKQAQLIGYKGEQHMVRLHSGGATDVGLWRSHNEDAFLVLPEAGIFALSDGMGGAAAGEIASAYFIETAQAVFNTQASLSGEPIPELVQKVFRYSNERISKHTAQHPADEGMGCTGDLLAISGKKYVIGHIGDSRVYLLRNGCLQQLTKDHSLVQLQVGRGVLTPEEAQHHPQKNIILRAIGIDPTDCCDILDGPVLNHDIFMLCSDGLTDMVDDSAIKGVLASTGSIQSKMKRLIEAALVAGGRDNVTVVLCEVEI
jgi:serine/threonine protein phosphatase PrpC